MNHIQSENINELVSALSKVQGELQPAIKDSANPFFKSKYADLSSIWNVCRPVLSKFGLAVIQSVDKNNEQLILITTLAHSSGQWMKSYAPLLMGKMDSQALGSSMSYMRRYCLAAIVGVVVDEDDDGEASMNRNGSSKSFDDFCKRHKVTKGNPAWDYAHCLTTDKITFEEVINKAMLNEAGFKKGLADWLMKTSSNVQLIEEHQ